MEAYWHIELYSGEIIKVKPDSSKIAYIQEMIAKQKGAITTPTRSIVIKDIKDFRLSDERYSDQKLLEGASQAFNEPMISEEGSIKARYVKKPVPQRKWDSHYSKIPAYKLLGESGNHVMIAFKLPINQINHDIVQELSPDDERRLSVNIS